MNRRAVWALVLILALGALTACEGGSVTKAHKRCSFKGNSGLCTGSFETLSGTYTVNVENDRVVNGKHVPIQVEVSVKNGPIGVWVKSPGDEITSIDVLSGQSATLEGVAVGDGEGFDVKFQASEDQAAGVSYEIAYQLR